MKKIYILLLLISSFCSAQNINFTIDDAVDNNVTITETIVNGGDIYVLTVDHPGSETLDDLGGGDLVFYLGSGGSNVTEPYVLSITRNGFPANFSLNGLDYDTLGAGSISVVNQDDQVISANTAYALGAGAITITNAANAVDISAFKILPGGTTEFNNFGFHNINVDMIQACVPPAGTAVFASQDCGSGDFFVNVNVTDLGGGSPAIFDGTTTTPVVSTGVVNLGPYPIGTPVSFTLQHGNDISCDVVLGTVSDTCPPPCISPEGTATLTSQDCTAETFQIDVNVTSLGSGSPVIFDGTTSTPVTVTGVTTLGPYPIGTPIAITLQHGNDNTCDVDLGLVGDTCSELIFTIDAAVDNVTNITETLIKDGDTYVLTVDHSGSETLDDLGGGDLVFYLGSGGANTTEPFVLTITRNGNPTNFTLKGIDYDTFEAGSISILNQDDNEISPNTLYPLGSGAIAITNASNAADISAFKIVPADSDDLNDFGFHNIKVDVPQPCVAPAATVVISSQDCTQGEFFVELDVTDLGSGGNPVLFDGTTSYSITVTGQTDIGPYPTGTPVNFTLQHGDDVGCDVDLGTITDTCPPPCESPAGTANLDTPFQDCDAGTFYVAINITDLGNGSPVLFDGSNSIPITSVTQFGIGPYPIGTPVTFTLQHGGDPTCDVDLGTIYNLACNDECADAIAINCGDTVTGSTVNATDSGNNASNDVFYSFTDTVLQDVTLSLCNSNFDTFIRVYDDCPQTNQIAGNDDSANCPGNQSEVTFTAQPNVTYYIMIEGYTSNNGAYEMSVACIPNVVAPDNDLCLNATPLPLGVTLTEETTAGATDDSTGNVDDTTCESFNFKSDVWYTFQAPVSGQATVTTVITGNSDQANVAVYSSTDCTQLDVDSIGCSSGNGGEVLTITGLTPNAIYSVRVWSDGVVFTPIQPVDRRIEGTFNITVTDATLSTSEIDNFQAFNYYPNPVKNELTLGAQHTIENVRVFNLLGQLVITETPNATTKSINMTQLQAGAYFVEVTIGNSTKTIRIIRE